MDVFRIHPAIGVARVGNSQQYVIAPESMAGSPVSEGSSLTGGLPIRAGTESDPIRSGDVRDANGALKRQAARFRIFHYPSRDPETWPRGDGSEIAVGATIAGRTVKDIVWTVHVANKKANTFMLVERGDYQGISGYADNRLPPIRNPATDKPNAPQPPDKLAVLNDPARVRQLTIDPGPRTISGTNTSDVHFDKPTVASYYDAAKAQVVALEQYPKSFPVDSFPKMDAPAGPIDTLGELATDAKGRLLVLGGYGRAASWRIAGPAPLGDAVNNDQWFDDTSDGPVSATLVFDDGTQARARGAWVTTTDPSYAPQIPNIVSLWDDVYDSWVRQLGLAPDIYDESKGGYQKSYRPTFGDQLAPIFQAVPLQQWTANLSPLGGSAHREVGAITAATDPRSTVLAGLTILRNPFEPDQTNIRLMPAHLGDAGEAFLTLRKTQYFFLQRWNEGRDGYRAGPGTALGMGEQLDKATMVNCLGGRFSPGIDLTFVMREPALYVQPWQTSGAGPFRVHTKLLDYATSGPDWPLLTGGYVPRHVETDGLEPGDLSKFMAIPWHTDYNSCATHPFSPNPKGNRTLFWSWPAQRPVAVYAANDVTWNQRPNSPLTPVLGQQRWSVRGEGTDSAAPENWGRYQARADILDNWHRIGVVMQGPAIDTQGTPFESDWYLEVASQLTDTGLTPVVPFPNYATNVGTTAMQLDERDLFFKLMNVTDHPDVLPDARAYVKAWLNWAEKFSNSPDTAPADQIYFEYTDQAFQDRLDVIYQELVDAAADSDPGAPGQILQCYADMVTRIVQLAPFNLVDGSWLHNIGRVGPIDEVSALLFSIWMDEMGDGDVARNHCNIYQDLCHSVGFYPPPINTREFAFDPRFLDSAFTVAAFELAISQFTEDYYPEIIGMTLQLEWEVLDLKPTRDQIVYFGIDPHFYVLHIGIDNAVNGHGQRAASAVRLYLQNIRLLSGEAAVQAAWRRIWNGFVAFGNMGFLGEDLANLVTQKSLRHQMIQMIERKANYGRRNHQQYTIGATRIDEWFANPPGFLDALEEHAWITPGNWANSRMHALMSFETGPMFRVFTDDEIALWAAYTESLAAPPRPPPPPVSAAHAMAALIDQLRPVQRGIPGHQTSMLADAQGMVHSIAWWMEQSTRSLMEALASPVNDVVVPGQPENSRFYMQLIAPTGPMGSVFGLPANPPNTGVCRDVVHLWISNGCPLPAAETSKLRLNTPRVKRDRHRTGRIHGMGTVH
jgi:L-Lysine epsilon oxidase N-terminal/L-lysine epsilon oxidase C-terminal domain/Iron-containing redox enzyme